MFGLRKDPAQKLRVLMSERDINTNELAYLTGLSRGTISRIRNGTVKNPTHETAYRIARALGVRTDSIWPNR
jgi:transcriptional regulator with XRE-family HTH domain